MSCGKQVLFTEYAGNNCTQGKEKKKKKLLFQTDVCKVEAILGFLIIHNKNIPPRQLASQIHFLQFKTKAAPEEGEDNSVLYST